MALTQSASIFSQLIFLYGGFLFFFLIYLFIYFWLHWVFVAVCGLSLVVASGATLPRGARASHCGGFSLLWSTGSRCVGFSSCGIQAQ